MSIRLFVPALRGKSYLHTVQRTNWRMRMRMRDARRWVFSHLLPLSIYPSPCPHLLPPGHYSLYPLSHEAFPVVSRAICSVSSPHAARRFPLFHAQLPLNYYPLSPFFTCSFPRCPPLPPPPSNFFHPTNSYPLFLGVILDEKFYRCKFALLPIHPLDLHIQ
jgi:hypothetical protein